MYVCALNMFLVPTEVRRRYQNPGTGVTDNSELLHGCWELYHRQPLKNFYCILLNFTCIPQTHLAYSERCTTWQQVQEPLPSPHRLASGYSRMWTSQRLSQKRKDKTKKRCLKSKRNQWSSAFTRLRVNGTYAETVRPFSAPLFL